MGSIQNLLDFLFFSTIIIKKANFEFCICNWKLKIAPRRNLGGLYGLI